MGKYDKLIEQNLLSAEEQEHHMNLAQRGMQEIADDAANTARIYHNADQILDDIDRRFEEATKLNKADIGFLMFAVALQCFRQYVLTPLTERFDDQTAAKNTKNHNEEHSLRGDGDWYLPTAEEILLNPVPFDANRQGELVSKAMTGGGKLGHRMVPGHDPILGWFYGTANIATSTITTVEKGSFHVRTQAWGIGKGRFGNYDTLVRPVETIAVFQKAIERFTEDGTEGYGLLATALAKEWVHLRSDIKSTNSLPLPVIGRFSPELANTFADYGIDSGHLEDFGKQFALAQLINIAIGMLHGMYCTYSSEAVGGELNSAGQSGLNLSENLKLDCYRVRTRKILLYSNLIASTSNILAVLGAQALAAEMDNAKLAQESLRYIDYGGYAVTLYRLVTDTSFIHKVKAEFLESEWSRKVLGEDYHFIAEAGHMSREDIKKGIEIQAKADAAKADKLSAGLQEHGEILRQIGEDQKQEQDRMNIVLGDMQEAEAQSLYGLVKKCSPADMDLTERRVLCAAIYTLMSNYGQNSEMQQRFYLNLEKYLGVNEREENFRFDRLNNIDSHAERMASLYVICAFLFLSDNSCDEINDKEHYGWLYDFAREREIRAVCTEIEKEFNTLGCQAIADRYSLPAPAMMNVSEVPSEREPVLQEEEIGEDAEEENNSKLKDIIDRYLCDEASFGKKFLTDYQETAKRELTRLVPDLSEDAVLAVTKVGNGCLIFTVYAMYLRNGGVMKSEYIRIPYRSMLLAETAMQEGRIRGSRKLILPYHTPDGSTENAIIDDSKIREESLRSLLKEIQESGFATAPTDEAVGFMDLDEKVLSDFTALATFILKKEKSKLTEAYLLCYRLKLTEHWAELADCIADDAEFTKKCSAYIESLPKLSRKHLLKAGVRLILAAVARTNYASGTELSRLRTDTEECIRAMAPEVSDAEFSKLQRASVREPGIVQCDYNSILSKATPELPYGEDILAGASDVIARIVKEREEKEQKNPANILRDAMQSMQKISVKAEKKKDPEGDNKKEAKETEPKEAKNQGSHAKDNQTKKKSELTTVMFSRSKIKILVPEGYERLKKKNPLQEAKALLDNNEAAFRKSGPRSVNLVMMEKIDPRNAMVFGDEKVLIDGIHQSLGENQGLIEVGSGKSKRGYDYIYSIIKTYLGQFEGVTYSLCLHIGLDSDIVEIKAQFSEQRMTGERDTVCSNYARGFGLIDLTENGFTGWNEDPYDPEYTRGVTMNLSEREGFDVLFPEHPLSQAREFLLAALHDEFVHAKGENKENKDSEDSDTEKEKMSDSDIIRSLFDKDGGCRRQCYNVDVK